MADNNTIRLKVVLDSQDAKKGLEELQSKIDEMFNNAKHSTSNSSNLNGSSGGSSNGGLGNSSINRTVNLHQQRNKQQTLGQFFSEGFQKNLGKFAPKLGAAAGAAMIAYIAKKSVDHLGDMIVANMFHGGGNNRRARENKETWELLKNGKFLDALFLRDKHLNERRLDAEKAQSSARMAEYANSRSTGISIGEMAEKRSMSMMTSIEDRMGKTYEKFKSARSRFYELDRERQALETGGIGAWGDERFENINRKFSKVDTKTYNRLNSEMESIMDEQYGKTGSWITPDTESDFHNRVVNERDESLKQMGQYASQFANQLINQPFIKPWSEGSFSDSFASRGINVGGVVDVSRANEPIIDELDKIANLLEKISEWKSKDYVGADASTILR